MFLDGTDIETTENDGGLAQGFQKAFARKAYDEQSQLNALARNGANFSRMPTVPCSRSVLPELSKVIWVRLRLGVMLLPGDDSDIVMLLWTNPSLPLPKCQSVQQHQLWLERSFRQDYLRNPTLCWMTAQATPCSKHHWRSKTSCVCVCQVLF